MYDITFHTSDYEDVFDCLSNLNVSPNDHNLSFHLSEQNLNINYDHNNHYIRILDCQNPENEFLELKGRLSNIVTNKHDKVDLIFSLDTDNQILLLEPKKEGSLKITIHPHDSEAL